MSVTVLATLKLKPGLADTVLGGLKEMLPDTRAFAGCEDVLVVARGDLADSLESQSAGRHALEPGDHR